MLVEWIMLFSFYQTQYPPQYPLNVKLRHLKDYMLGINANLSLPFFIPFHQVRGLAVARSLSAARPVKKCHKRLIAIEQKFSCNSKILTSSHFGWNPPIFLLYYSCNSEILTSSHFGWNPPNFLQYISCCNSKILTSSHLGWNPPNFLLQYSCNSWGGSESLSQSVTKALAGQPLWVWQICKKINMPISLSTGGV